ncbi:MAG: hypothetical protein ACREJ3_04965, partial [Polyangiaceae bacterium]
MRSRAAVTVAFITAAWLASSSAGAQVAPTGGPTVALSALPYPNRILPNGTNLGSGPRPQNLTPLGISYSDCIADQTLDFSVLVSGFTGSANLQVWATQSGDCTQDADRGVGGIPKCWIVSTGITGLVAQSPTAKDFLVRVQDLVGWQNNPPTSAAYQPLGPSACSAQPSFTAVPLSIYFLPLAGTTLAAGAAPLKYSITTDLVGPPAPLGVSIDDGDTLFVANWTQNVDSDTLGYDVFMDPVPGQAAGSSAASDAGALVRVCSPAASTASTPDASPEAGSDDAATVSDAATDATAAMDAMTAADASGTSDAMTSVDAGADAAVPMNCHYENQGGTVPGASTGGMCHDSNLTAAAVQDGGTSI